MMIISEHQKEQYRKEGCMVIPGFLDESELASVRDICDRSVEAIELDLRSRGLTADRINILGKKYFISNSRKTFPALNNIIFSEKAKAVCKAAIGPAAYLHNEVCR